MKKIFLFLLVIAGMTLSTAAQESKTMYIMKDGAVVYQSAVSEIDSIIFYKPAFDEDGVVINGVRWATRNVDAPGKFATKPEDLGMFYQWNRRIGWSTTSQLISSNGETTWGNSTPSGTTWEKVNDPSPVGWRVPTTDEIETLLDYSRVRNEWATENGILGRKFTDRVSGNSIFLPAAGYRVNDYGTLYHPGVIGTYWSSIPLDPLYAYSLTFSSSSAYRGEWGYRYNGFSIRAVAE